MVNRCGLTSAKEIQGTFRACSIEVVYRITISQLHLSQKTADIKKILVGCSCYLSSNVKAPNSQFYRKRFG